MIQYSLCIRCYYCITDTMVIAISLIQSEFQKLLLRSRTIQTIAMSGNYASNCRYLCNFPSFVYAVKDLKARFKTSMFFNPNYVT